MATAKTNRKKATTAQAAPETVLPRLDGRTPKEAADNMRKQAEHMANYRNRPEVRWAIARDPTILAMVLDLERQAAVVREKADRLEATLGDMTAAEFAALNEYTDKWARDNPEQAAELIRDAGNGGAT